MHGNLCFPLRRAYLLLLCKESKFFSLFLLFLSFGKHHVVRKDLGTYVQLNMGGISYYCWHRPWGEYVERRNYKPLSFNVSGWNILLMCMQWVLAIIEDYMMVEYVDLPKGSDTWPFLKRWWIVVAKLTENIVCWFSIEFTLLLRCCDKLLLAHKKLYDKVCCCFNNKHDAAISVFCFYRHLSL